LEVEPGEALSAVEALEEDEKDEEDIGTRVGKGVKVNALVDERRMRTDKTARMHDRVVVDVELVDGIAWRTAARWVTLDSVYCVKVRCS
jgi:hypothetical protein